MFKKGPDIDKKKLLSKALDVKKDSLSRLKHFKTLIEHLDINEAPSLFRTHFSFIYHTFIDTFSTFDCNSKQRRDDLDCIIFMLEKILIYNPELIKKRWQFYSITFVMQKLLHQNNTWRLRQEGVRLFVLWYEILCDETNLELQTMFSSLVPGIVPQQIKPPQASQQTNPQQSTSTQLQQQQHSLTNQNSTQLPVKLCSIDPLVPMLPNEQLPNDETSFYLDSLLQFMVTQITKPFWGSPDEARKNQELSFSFMFNMFKKIYLQHLFPDFCNINNNNNPLTIIESTKNYYSNNTIHQYVDEVAIDNYTKLNSQNNDNDNIYKPNSNVLLPTKAKRDLHEIDLKQSNHYSNINNLTSQAMNSMEYERLMTYSIYQSIVIRWLTRILRQDMIPGQDELIKSGGSSVERGLNSQSALREQSSGQILEQEFSYVSDANSTTIFQNMDSTSREMEIARRVTGTWPDNIAVIHELFRRAFLNFYQPASMKRVVNVYKEWICNGGPNQTNARGPRLGYTSFGDLLQIFVTNSSNAFVTRVNSQTVLDEQVEMCKRIMNIYRYMVMKIYMNTATWEQLLNVMLSITEHLFPMIPPEKKETTIGGRIAPAFFQTFIVSWIRANLYVHISNQMWDEFHRVMKNLIRWRELLEEWSTTMGSLTRVLVKHVYSLNLTDLPLDKPQERRRRPKAMKSFSTAEAMTSGSGGANKLTNNQSGPNDSVDSPNSANITDQSSKNNSTRPIRSGSIRFGYNQSTQSGGRGLIRSNSDGIIVLKNSKLYYSSIESESVNFNIEIRKIKSEYQLFEANLDETNCNRSNSPSNNDVIEGTSLKDHHMIIDNDNVMDSQNQILTTSCSSANKSSTTTTATTPTSNSSLDGMSTRSNNNIKKMDSKSNVDKCVLLGGSIRGWTPENSLIMWRRMLGLFGNINQIEDPDNHLIAIRCLAVILCDFIKTRENLGISVDNQSTPEQPNLIPPYTYHVGWLLEATHLPIRQFKESCLTAYKLLCLMSIRRHDIELPQQYYTAFYEALHRGLNSSDLTIQASIIKNSTQLLSLELPGSTFLVQDLYESSKSILLNNSKELPIATSPRDQAVQILNAILALNKPIKKLMVLKYEINNSMNLVAPGDIKTKIFDTFLACNMPPVLLDCQTRSRSLCSMTIHVYQELCDKYDSFDVEKLFDTLLTDLQDSNNNNLFRINCDLLRLFAEHGQSLAQSRPTLVSSVIQIICQLIVRLSTDENNKEAIHCLLICLEDWCMAVGKNYLLKSVEQLSIDGSGDEDTSPSSVILKDSLNECLINIVLRSLENVINDEQFVDDSSNKTTKGSINTSKGSDTHSNSGKLSQSGQSNLLEYQKDRTMTNDLQRSSKQLDNNNLTTSLTAAAATTTAVNKNLTAIKLACKVLYQKFVTYLGHFPFKQIGAASIACCVNEADYLCPNDMELVDFKNVSNINLLVIDDNTIVSFIGATLNNNKNNNISNTSQNNNNNNNNNHLPGPIHLIVRNLCGKYSWDVSNIDFELTNQLLITELDKDSIIVDPDTFQQEDGRSSMKYDSDFNDEANSSSSLSSRSSTNRDYFGDLLNQLTSLASNNSSSSTSSSQNLYNKKRNCAQSISNPKYKVAQAEETMIALLTNQRFQELNYCERSDDLDRVVLNINTTTNRTSITSNNKQKFELDNSIEEKQQQILSSEQCRQLIQQLGLLNWDKRCKVDSLSKSARLLRELKNLDSQPGRETHKIAVIYIANGQEDKNSILANTNSNRAFEDFVSGLGWEINLATHMGFKGGLQSNKSTGETSPYYCNSTTEVIFHVSTRIPIIGSADDESLNRKLRHIGNDEIHIVWSEHTRDYRRGIIPTEFGDVVIAIYPMLTFQGYYRIQISSKQEVPIFGPLFDNCIVHQTSLASLVRATAINASRAKRLKLPYYQSHFEERSRLIGTIVQNHREKNSFEEFAVQLYHLNHNNDQSSNNNSSSNSNKGGGLGRPIGNNNNLDAPCCS